MYAWTVSNYGHYHTVLNWTTLQRPQPKSNEVLIRVSAAGVNFSDILSIAGLYQIKPDLPFTPGSEAVGTIVAKGENVSLDIGDRVIGVSLGGAFGEFMLVEEGNCSSVPTEMRDRDAAGFTITYQTAYFALVHRAKLIEGEVLLVHGGAGGVGVAAIQIGKALGATVVATASTDRKLDICRANGADFVIDYTQADFVDAVMQITGGKGANVILDPVGGDAFDQSTKCVAWEGRIVTVGFTSGTIPTIQTNRILLKNMSIVGLFWGYYLLRDPRLVVRTQKELYDMYARGDLTPVVCKEFALSDLPQALDLLERRKSYGKVILTGE